MIQVVVALVRSVVGGGGVRVVVLRVENPHGLTKGGQKPVLCIQRRLISFEALQFFFQNASQFKMHFIGARLFHGGNAYELLRIKLMPSIPSQYKFS